MRPILFPFCLALSAAPAAFAGPPVDGIVDTAFGNAGLARIDPDDAGLGVGQFMRDIARSPTSGKFYLLGSDGALTLARMSADGQLDTSFDGDGYATQLPSIPNRLTEQLFRVAVTFSGKPVVAGAFHEIEADASDSQGLVCRFNVAGNPDTGFDGDGCRLFELDFGNTRGADSITALAPLPGDALLVAGTARNALDDQRGFIAKLNADGSYDQSFGLGGLRYFDFPLSDFVRVEQIAVAGDGGIFVAGGRSGGGIRSAFVIALNAEGDPRPGYGDNGIAEVSFVNEFPAQANVGHYATGLVVDAAGRATHCGHARDFNTTTLLITLARFDADGELDPGFDGDGRLITSFNELNAVNSTGPCVLDRHGRLTLSMHTGQQGSYDPELALMRFRADGSTDEDFHGSGRLALPLNLGVNGIGSELVGGLVAQGDDLILAGTATLKNFLDNPSTPHEFVALRLRDDRMLSDGFEGAD